MKSEIIHHFSWHKLPAPKWGEEFGNAQTWCEDHISNGHYWYDHDYFWIEEFYDALLFGVHNP